MEIFSEPVVTHRTMPLRALVISIGALSIPMLGGLLFPDWTGEEAGVLLWLTALVPAFLLTYYRGWRGASLGLALGMAVLSVTQVILVVTNAGTPNWSLLFGIVLAYIGICFGIGWVAELLHNERRKAQNMALTDALTELPNRRHATIFLDAAFAAAGRGTPLAVVLFDLDRFKDYNDVHGHQAGDEALRVFGAILAQISRRMNLVARYGGEEFIAVLSASEEEGAVIFADRVCGRLRKAELRGGPLTTSVGIASYEKGMGTPDLLVAAADRALYAAKAAGRDSICGIREGKISDITPAVRSGGAAASEPGRVAGAGGDGYETMRSGGVNARELPLKPADPAAPGGSRPLRAGGQVPRRGRPAPTTELGRALQRKENAAVRPPPAGRLLLVDDDFDSRTDVALLLERLGYVVIEASNAADGLARYTREPDRIDLVVADLVMDGTSGFTMAEQMLKVDPGLRVLYMSSLLHYDVTWTGAPGAVTDFVQKPMLLDVLATKVESVLEASLAPLNNMPDAAANAAPGATAPDGAAPGATAPDAVVAKGPEGRDSTSAPTGVA